MQKPINKEQLQQYIDIFGKEKMINLFADYKLKITEDMPKLSEAIDKKDLNSIRIIYHSIASASLVFGMQNFAVICRKIEEMVLQNAVIKELEPSFAQAETAFEQDIKQAEAYLENIDE